MCQSRSDLIENAERFAQINLDLSDFEKERTHYIDKTTHSVQKTRSAPVIFTLTEIK